MSLLLSIDGSSTVCGYTIWNKETKEWLEMSYLKFNSEHTLIQRAEEFKDFLDNLMARRSGIDEMVIEESFTKFGTSNDKVIAMLNQINILYRYICHMKGIKTNTITVQESRKAALPKAKFLAKKLAGGMDHKEQAFFYLLAQLGEAPFPKKVMKSGPRKGQEVFIDEARDMSDSWIVGCGFLNMKK